FYVTGHPLDDYTEIFAAGGYQPIVSLRELADRATFRIAGAIAQVDKKFTKKEGKPFAVVWLEDLSGTLEVVLWNEVYMTAADSIVPGRVIAIKGTLDKRDDGVRATAQRVKVLAPDHAKRTVSNGSDESPLVLRFAPEATADELRAVKT